MTKYPSIAMVVFNGMSIDSSFFNWVTRLNRGSLFFKGIRDSWKFGFLLLLDDMQISFNLLATLSGNLESDLSVFLGLKVEFLLLLDNLFKLRPSTQWFTDFVLRPLVFNFSDCDYLQWFLLNEPIPDSFV